MNPFISDQDLSDYLGRDVSADPRTVIALDAACDIVRGYIRQDVNLVEDDLVKLDGTGSRTVPLPELPVLSVTDVTVYDTDGQNEDVLVVNDDYILGNHGLLIRVGTVWRPGRRNVWVTYSHGWDITGTPPYDEPEATGVPSDIRMVALQLAARTYTAPQYGNGSLRSETIGNYSYTTAGDAGTSPIGLLAGEARILDRWRQKRVA